MTVRLKNRVVETNKFFKLCGATLLSVLHALTRCVPLRLKPHSADALSLLGKSVSFEIILVHALQITEIPVKKYCIVECHRQLVFTENVEKRYFYSIYKVF